MSGIIPTSSVNAVSASSLSGDPTIANDGAFQAALDDAISSQTAGSTASVATATDAAPTGPNALALSLDDQKKVRVKIHKSAQDFEAMFLSQMMEPMFAGLKTEAPFGGGYAEESWRSFLVQEFGKSVAKAGGVGVSKMIEGQLLDLAGLSGKAKPSVPTGAPDALPIAPHTPPNLNMPNALSDPTRLTIPKMGIKA